MTVILILMALAAVVLFLIFNQKTQCRNCGFYVPARAPECPNCGCRLPSTKDSHHKR